MQGTRHYTGWIVLISVFIPLLVAFIFYGPLKFKLEADLSYLPRFHAILNSLTTLFLITGYMLIRNGKISQHRFCMITALVLSATFLISYVTYHITNPPASYGGEGIIRSVYFFILITHIILAIVIVPMVLVTVSRALRERFDKHKRIARWTLPVWLYVTTTGVVVYLMMVPYY